MGVLGVLGGPVFGFLGGPKIRVFWGVFWGGLFLGKKGLYRGFYRVFGGFWAFLGPDIGILEAF